MKSVEVGADEEEAPPKKATAAYSLPFDVARRFAQPLGIHLDEWEKRIIDTQKGVVRLMAVTERSKQLFGESGADIRADEMESYSDVITPTQSLPGGTAKHPWPSSAAARTSGSDIFWRVRRSRGCDDTRPPSRRHAVSGVRPH